jgi:hypothetical protein
MDLISANKRSWITIVTLPQMIKRFSAVIANLEDLKYQLQDKGRKVGSVLHRPDYLYVGSELSPSSPNHKEQKG